MRKIILALVIVSIVCVNAFAASVSCFPYLSGGDTGHCDSRRDVIARYVSGCFSTGRGGDVHVAYAANGNALTGLRNVPTADCKNASTLSPRLQNAYAVSITRFAIGRHHEGRSLGTVTSSCDVMSPHCQNLGRSKVKNFGLAENITDSFTSEAAATDSRYPVDRTVQFKMDFIEGWLQEQTKRDRSIIVDLAMGESTGDVARK